MCSDEEKYREFLDLPVVVYPGHPLCMSVAHKIHGKGMATGWRANPQSLSDRIDENNNLLIETQFSNYGKLDYAFPWYDDIKSIFRGTFAPKHLYDRNRVPQTAIDPDIRDALVKSEGRSEETIETGTEVQADAALNLAEADGTRHLPENDVSKVISAGAAGDDDTQA